LPLRQSFARVPEDPGPMGTINPDSSASGMKSSGLTKPRSGCSADQRLGAEQRTGDEVDNGLVVHDEFGAIQGAPQRRRAGIHSLALARSTSLKSSTRSPPRDLARYIAAVASRSRLSGVAPSSAMAIPMLAVAVVSVAPPKNGTLMA
jgi:hypothetical protein